MMGLFSQDSKRKESIQMANSIEYPMTAPGGPRNQSMHLEDISALCGNESASSRESIPRQEKQAFQSVLI